MSLDLTYATWEYVASSKLSLSIEDPMLVSVAGRLVRVDLRNWGAQRLASWQYGIAADALVAKPPCCVLCHTQLYFIKSASMPGTYWEEKPEPTNPCFEVVYASPAAAPLRPA